MALDPLIRLSGAELAARIRTRELSSLEAVDAHIAQIQRVNPRLNAMVAERFAAAREEARRADAVLAATADPAELPPFHGVPCSIKECFALTGMPQTSGLVSRRGFVAPSDATAVARLRAAGAIPLGVTNVSELCMWMESNNRVYGRSNNPYDPRRTVGGSSGGEGAIVGAGGAPFGLGSDVGGSIRMPAFFNGVFGHKPTGGLIPNSGQFPMPTGDVRRYCTTGPLARRAEDLMPLVRILAGPDGIDGGCIARTLGDPASVRLEGLRVVSIEDNGLIPVSNDLRQAQRRVAEALAARGARVEWEHVPRLKQSLEIWSAMLATGGADDFAALLGDGTPVNAWKELAKWSFGRSNHTLPAIVLALLEKVPKWTPGRTQRLAALGAELRAQLVDLIGPRGVLLYPPYASVAPRHAFPLVPPICWAYTAILNVMELPVTQVPLGLDANGVPLGVQVAAVHGNDHLTIGVACELERIFGGWVVPSLAA
ncbi:MAG: amidase [bacterium]